MTAPMTKFSVHVPSADRIPELMRRALRVSFTRRPWVVHHRHSENIINQPTEMDESAIRAPESYRRTTPIQADPVLVSKAAKMLVDAQQPVIHAGSGVYHAGAEPGAPRVWRNCSPHR